MEKVEILERQAWGGVTSTSFEMLVRVFLVLLLIFKATLCYGETDARDGKSISLLHFDA